jgi:transglutaminase superfamily protein
MRRVRFIDGALALLIIRSMLVTLGFPRTFRILERRALRVVGDVEPDLQTMETAARTVLAAAVMIPGRIECLEQSLALWYLLRCRGVGVEIVFGMRQYPFGAHAWVSYRGEPLNEDREALRQYAAFA